MLSSFEIFLTIVNNIKVLSSTSKFPILAKCAFKWQIFLRFSNIKFEENSLSGSQVDTCGWKDGQNAPIRLFLQLMRTRLKRINWRAPTVTENAKRMSATQRRHWSRRSSPCKAVTLRGGRQKNPCSFVCTSRYYVFTKMVKPTLGHIQPPKHRYCEQFSWRSSRRACGLSPPFSVEVKERAVWTAFCNTLVKERYKTGYKWREEKEEDVSSSACVL